VHSGKINHCNILNIWSDFIALIEEIESADHCQRHTKCYRYCVLLSGPLQALYMTSDIDRELSTYVTSPSSVVTSSILLNEGQVLPIRCVVQSGCPSPFLTMRVGAHDVTSHFRRTEHPVVITGERGLRTMMCTTSLWSWAPPSQTTSSTGYSRPRARPGGRDGAEEGQFVVLERYDGGALRCSVSPGPNRVESNGTEVGLLVQCESNGVLIIYFIDFNSNTQKECSM